MSLIKKILKTHFEGGSNLAQGGQTKDGEGLADLIRTLEGEGQVLALQSTASAGGGATEDDVAVVGLLATDTILSVTQRVPGAGVGKVFIGWADKKAGSLDLTWDDDPGAGAIVVVAVKRVPTS